MSAPSTPRRVPAPSPSHSITRLAARHEHPRGVRLDIPRPEASSSDTTRSAHVFAATSSINSRRRAPRWPCTASARPGPGQITLSSGPRKTGAAAAAAGLGSRDRRHYVQCTGRTGHDDEREAGRTHGRPRRKSLEWAHCTAGHWRSAVARVVRDARARARARRKTHTTRDADARRWEVGTEMRPQAAAVVAAVVAAVMAAVMAGCRRAGRQVARPELQRRRRDGRVGQSARWAGAAGPRRAGGPAGLALGSRVALEGWRCAPVPAAAQRHVMQLRADAAVRPIIPSSHHPA